MNSAKHSSAKDVMNLQGFAVYEWLMMKAVYG
jgi:hypothetical protein